jgi:DNA-binding XRE family transcriptional regulator
MRKRRPKYRLVKIHRSYTVEEAARLLGAHKNTVRAWVKVGLPTCDSKRPTLILGRELAAYLQARRTKNKRPCKPGEIYCVRCRAPKRPAGGMAEYHPTTATLGNLIGICPDCEGSLRPFVGSSSAKNAGAHDSSDQTRSRDPCALTKAARRSSSSEETPATRASTMESCG